MKADYEQQARRLEEALQALHGELEQGTEAESPFLAAFRRHQNICELTRDVLIEFVDHIKVYEGRQDQHRVPLCRPTGSV